jgi:hypothetical protein
MGFESWFSEGITNGRGREHTAYKISRRKTVSVGHLKNLHIAGSTMNLCYQRGCAVPGQWARGVPTTTSNLEDMHDCSTPRLALGAAAYGLKADCTSSTLQPHVCLLQATAAAAVRAAYAPSEIFGRKILCV